MDTHAIDIKHRTVILPILYLLERDFGQAPENTVKLVYSMGELLNKMYSKYVLEIGNNPQLTEHDARRLSIQSLVDHLARNNKWSRKQSELVDEKLILGRMYEIEKMVDALESIA